MFCKIITLTLLSLSIVSTSAYAASLPAPNAATITNSAAEFVRTNSSDSAKVVSRDSCQNMDLAERYRTKDAEEFVKTVKSIRLSSLSPLSISEVAAGAYRTKKRGDVTCERLESGYSCYLTTYGPTDAGIAFDVLLGSDGSIEKVRFDDGDAFGACS